MLRLLLQVVAVLLVCVPLSLVVTFVLLPVWSWLEASYKISRWVTLDRPNGAMFSCTAS